MSPKTATYFDMFTLPLYEKWGIERGGGGEGALSLMDTLTSCSHVASKAESTFPSLGPITCISTLVYFPEQVAQSSLLSTPPLPPPPPNYRYLPYTAKELFQQLWGSGYWNLSCAYSNVEKKDDLD
jgi:hypothetical protein